MSEAALSANNISMYDEVAEINQLNKVEGFDPKKYMRIISAEGEPQKYYLDVAFRKLWFRLKHPMGKIVKKILKLDEQVAIVEARVYLDRNDPENNYISNALAQRYKTEDSQFGMKYVELAETAAVGRALSDAGFGLQFADKEQERDPDVTEAPIDTQIIHGQSMIPETGEMVDPMQNASWMQPKSVSRQPETSKTEEIRSDMPVEEIYGKLTYEAAAKVVVSVGRNRGKTLGQLAMEKPGDLTWYANAYEGRDNLLKAASKFLIDQALAPAS